MERETLSVSYGRDYNSHGCVYEYCVFCGDDLIARKGGFKSTSAARKAGEAAAHAILEMYQEDMANTCPNCGAPRPVHEIGCDNAR